MGSVFSTDMTKGKTAAKFIINYEDGSIEEFPIIAKEDYSIGGLRNDRLA